MIAPNLQSLQHKVRYALEPDNPHLLHNFAILQITFARQSEDLRTPCLEALFRVLLDTAADEILPAHWRSQCFDSLHKPLSELWNSTGCDEHRCRVIRLCQEMTLIGQYAAHSMNNPHLSNKLSN